MRNQALYSFHAGSRLALVLAAALLAHANALAKRPLTHADYDSWRTIQNQQLSPDGKFLAYAVFPQEGDGELVARNLATGQEWRKPVGARPPAPPPDYSNPDARPQPPGVTLRFTADSRFVAFSTFPSQAETEKARKEKKKPEEMPKGGLTILELASGRAFHIPRVKSFQTPEKGSGFVAWMHEPQKSEKGGELVLRNLADQSERKFTRVVEYTLSKDAATLVYADANGIYALTLPPDGAPQTLLSGKGSYAKPAWDEEQNKLAFLCDRGDASSTAPRYKLYLWERGAQAAVELVSPDARGLRPGFFPSDKGSISFSRDGVRVYFGVAPSPSRQKAAEEEENVEVDLWHWRDDFVPPMQKVRARMERDRTYRAVCHLSDKAVVQVADPALAEVTFSEDGRWAIGRDDRDYRTALEHSERHADFYLVDTQTGNRKRVLEKHAGSLTWSPDGRHALFFDGKDWNTIAVPDGSITNLTAALNGGFFQEDFDRPQTRPGYGTAGWTKDGKYVLLYDRFDIWQAAPDGSVAKNLTGGAGRRQRIMFRRVKLDPEERAIDPSKPLLLRAEHAETHDTGFFLAHLDEVTAPRKLLFEARNFGVPIKARDSNVLVLTTSSFNEFPDLLVTNDSMQELDKVSDANPQKRELLWGSAEMVRFTNLDGVPASGVLYKPENFDPRKKYPLLVYIYERLSQNIHQFVEPRPGHSINFSYYVSNGYLVFTPDIIYTVGYPGQSALKCVLPGIQAVVDRGFVDEKAIGIQGHSWGGYQIAYMITRTNRFRAASAGAPVANMTSAYSGMRWGPGLPRQFQYERSQSRIGGSLWQYPERFIENSPVFRADWVQTPLLMLHNDADDAVPWYQGIEYFLALRRLGKEVYLFNYNGEPHGLRKRINQEDYAVRLQEFFDHHLKGAPKPDWMERGEPYIERN
jgi:dipeptidyl aminopeptidase/acylaminoacyl peptidase